MKVSRKKFLAALDSLAKAVHPRAGIPTLTGVKIEVADGIALLTRSDLDVGARIPLLIETEPGEAWLALPTARAVSDLLRVTRADTVDFRMEGDRLRVGVGRFQCWSIEDFPTIEFPEPTLVFDAQEAREVFGVLAGFASDDEARPTLTGVGFEVHGRRLALVATDSYRLAAQEFDLAEEQEDREGIIPAHFLRFVAAQIGPLSGQIEVGFEGLDAGVLFPDGRSFHVQTIAGSFPAWRKLIRGAMRRCPGLLRFADSDAAEEACRIAMAVLGEHEPMVFHLSETAGLLVAGPPNSPHDDFSTRIEGASWSGEPTRVTYNPSYFLAGLRAAPGARIHMPEGDLAPLQPAIFRRGGFTHALMPVRLPTPIGADA